MTYQTARSIQIKEDNGQVHKFTQSEIDTRGIRLYMGDTPIRISQLNPGDKITATIVTEGKPEILTAQAVDAQLAAPDAAACARRSARAGSRSRQRPKRRPPAPAAEPAAEPAPEPQAMEQAAPAPAPAEESTEPARCRSLTSSNPFFWLLVLIIIVALIWVLDAPASQERRARIASLPGPHHRSGRGTSRLRGPGPQAADPAPCARSVLSSVLVRIRARERRAHSRQDPRPGIARRPPRRDC